MLRARLPIFISSDFKLVEVFAVSTVFSISSVVAVMQEVVAHANSSVRHSAAGWLRVFMVWPFWVVLFSNTNSFQESLFYGDKWVTLGQI